MAIAFDAASAFQNTTTGTFAYNHTCTGLNGALLVGVACQTSDSVTGVTYNGVAMTLVAKIPITNAVGYVEFYLFALINPATGTNSVSVTITGSLSAASRSVSYTGVLAVDAHNSTTVSGATSVSPSVTTIADNCWSVGWFENDTAVFAAGTATTMRGATTSFVFGDSNAAKHPAGSVTLQMTWTGSGNGGAIIASLSPAGPPPPQGYDWPNPRRVTPSPQRFSQEFTNHPLYFPPPPIPYGQQIHFPNPVRQLSYEGWRWGFTNSTPLGLYTPYFPLLTDVILLINGVNYTTYVDATSTVIDDILNEQPNTCEFKIRGFQPNIGSNVQIGLGSVDPNRLIFAGIITTITQTYESTPQQTLNIAWVCDCIDYTFLLSTARPTGSYTNVSATAAIQDLVSRSNLTVNTSYLPANLPAISMTFDGSDNLATIMTNICTTIAYNWKVDYSNILRVFQTDTGTPPTTIDMNNITTQVNPVFEYEIDITQARTRVIGRGAFQSLVTAVSAAETILPLDSVSMFSAAGGGAYLGPIQLAYTGVQTTVGGSLIGPGASPAASPTATLSGGTGLNTGNYEYAYTFVTASGETLAGPLTVIATGPLAPPIAISPDPTAYAGAGVTSGSPDYEITFVTAVGETTPSPASGNVPVGGTVPAPSPGPYGFSFGPPAGTGTYQWAITFIDASGHETAISAILTSTTCGPISGGASADINYQVQGPLHGISSVKLYRTALNGSTFGYVSTNVYSGAGFFAFFDSTADGSLGAAPSGPNSTYSQVLVPLQLGGTFVTGRNVYRNVSGTFKKVGTIADNTTTTFLDTIPDGSAGAAAPVTNTAALNQVALTAIAVGPSGTTSRNVYRTVVGGSQLKLLTSVADNVTTTYTDSTADGSLGANAPISDTSGLSIPVTNGAGFQTTGVTFSANGAATVANTASPVFTSASYTFVAGDVGNYLYIASGTNWTPGQYLIVSVAAGAATVAGPIASVASPTAATWGVNYAVAAGARYSFTDMVIDASTATKFTSAAHPVGVNFVGNVINVGGGLGFISQRVTVVSVSGTTATCDKSLGTLSSTGGIGNLGGSVLPTSIPMGSTTLLVASNGFASASGGWIIANGIYIRYTGVSGNLLTGIPSSGIGAISAALNYGTTVVSVVAITGVTGGVLANPSGANVGILVQADDAVAQAAMQGIVGGSGVFVYQFTDTAANTIAGLTTEVTALLQLFKNPLTTVTESARDINTVSGRPLTIILLAPMSISAQLTIQKVHITNIGTEKGQYPLFNATASSVKYQFQDFLLQLGALVAQ